MGKKKDKTSASSSNNEDYIIQPSSKGKRVDTTKWPLLLKNYEKLNVK